MMHVSEFPFRDSFPSKCRYSQALGRNATVEGSRACRSFGLSLRFRRLRDLFSSRRKLSEDIKRSGERRWMKFHR